MSLQTRTYGATNFTYFNQDSGANITSPLGLDFTGSNQSGSINNPLHPIRIRTLQITFSNSAGNVVYKLAGGNNTSDVWASGSISTTTGTTISPTATANYPAFVESTLFYGYRKLDGSTTRVQRGDVANQMFFNGSARNGPIRATVVWETAPSAPSTPTLSSRTETAITIAWSGPGDDGGTGITGYRILFKRAVDSTWSTIRLGNVGSHTISGLQVNTSYNFAVAATNGVTDSINSNYSSQDAQTGTNSGTLTTSTLNWTTPVWSTTSPLPVATRASAYSTTLSASPVTSYQLVSGSLPAGLSFNTSNGVISGTPTTVQTATFTIRAINNTVSADRAFSLTVNPALPAFTDQTVSSPARTRVSYSDGVSATEAASYSVFSGSLPSGLTLNTSTGAITGSPTAPGTFNFVIRATNVTGSTNTPTLTITVFSSIRVWNGSAFVFGRTRVWNGSSFVEGRIRVWNGSSWVDTN